MHSGLPGCPTACPKASLCALALPSNNSVSKHHVFGQGEGRGQRHLHFQAKHPGGQKEPLL